MNMARDVMAKKLITLRPDTTAEDAIRTLLDNKISGAPILDETGGLAGIISEYQLLAVIYNEEFRNTPVGELMTREVLTVDENEPLTGVASKFIRHRIRRLPVMRDGKVVGQISRRDIIRFAVDRPDRFERFVAMFNGSLPLEATEAVT